VNLVEHNHNGEGQTYVQRQTPKGIHVGARVRIRRLELCAPPTHIQHGEELRRKVRCRAGAVLGEPRVAHDLRNSEIADARGVTFVDQNVGLYVVGFIWF
jgi:hypothetical protein